MVKNKQKTTKSAHKVTAKPDRDGVYLLKLVMYLILGAQWLWLETPAGQRIPIPAGLVIGIAFAMHDHFRIDRKIEYAVLLVAMLIGFVANIGVFVSI